MTAPGFSTKRMVLALLVGLVPMISGCAVSDMLFGAFGHYYSDGGYTRADREYHYRHRLEAIQNHDRLNPTSIGGLLPDDR